MTDDLVKRLRDNQVATKGVAIDAAMIEDAKAASILEKRASLFGHAADRIEALERDLAARDKAHECDAQIAADLIAGEQAKRYEVEAERDKLIAALKDAQEYAEGLELQLAEANKAFATLAQATQETSNATQEKQNG
jgi:hypothetical protein